MSNEISFQNLWSHFKDSDFLRDYRSVTIRDLYHMDLPGFVSGNFLIPNPIHPRNEINCFTSVSELSLIGKSFGLEAMSKVYSKNLIGTIIQTDKPRIPFSQATHVNLYSDPDEGIWKYIKSKIQHNIWADVKYYFCREPFDVTINPTVNVMEYITNHWIHAMVPPIYAVPKDVLADQFNKGYLGYGREPIPKELPKYKRGY